MEATTVKASKNEAQVIGTLSEMNLKEETKEVTIKNGAMEKKVTCRQISKNDFKNPMFTVESGTSIVKVDAFPVKEKSLNENGEIVDNSRFKEMETIMNTYVTKVGAKEGEVPIRVKIDGFLINNEFVDKTGNFVSTPKVTMMHMSSTQVPEEDSTDSVISGVIKNIAPETLGEDDHETGRLKVELYYFNKDGNVFPVTFVVEKDLADSFTSFYEVGQSVLFDYEVVVRSVGSTKPITGGFGHRESKQISGYDITEFSIFRGSDPIGEDEERYISIETVKSALKERDIIIENKLKEAKEKPEGGYKSSPKSATGKETPFGTPTENSKKNKNPFA